MAVFIVASHAADVYFAIQMRQVGSHVGRAAQHGSNARYLVDRHRRFRRNALNLAVKIAVQHYIADNGNFKLLYFFC